MAKKKKKPTQPAPASESKLAKLSKKWYAIIGVIFTILGWVAFKDTISDWFQSDHTKYKNENFIPGFLIPHSSDSDTLIFQVGTTPLKLAIGDLRWHEIKGFGGILNCVLDAPFENFSMKLEDKKLYFSLKIVDIEKEEVIGIMDYNHWSLFKPNLLDYYNDDNTLEVLDRQGNVAFSIQLIGLNIIKLRGYFISQKNISIVADDRMLLCVPKDSVNDKKAAIKIIKSISRIRKK
jgi:hypothetical protein